jgi:hypothetical protein
VRTSIVFGKRWLDVTLPDTIEADAGVGKRVPPAPDLEATVAAALATPRRDACGPKRAPGA